MKKIFLAMLLLASMAATAFAKSPAPVDQQVLSSFNKDYSGAENIQWQSVGSCLKASFTLNGQPMFAYYRKGGEQVAVTRNLTLTQLPILLATDLRARLKNQWLTELFEISTNGETAYFATLSSASQTTVLKADSYGRWTMFKKTRRAVQ